MSDHQDCCSSIQVNDLQNHFDEPKAKEDALDYLENGLNDRGEKLIAYIDTETPGFASALDIGCGVGAVHQELLQRNLIKKAVGIDVSASYLALAQSNAEKLNLRSRVNYFQVDFAVNSKVGKPADIVILDRVVCCYPEIEPLLTPAVKKAKKFFLISSPRDTLLERLIFLGSRLKHIVTRSQFRLYYHNPKKIRSLIEAEGFTSVHEDVNGEWQLSVYERTVRNQ